MMRKIFTTASAVTAIALLSVAGSVSAADDSNEESSIFPVEIYACNFNEGKGPGDLDGWVSKWNAWADKVLAPYSAWTLTPFYYGEEQTFDFLWLGTSTDAATMGRAYDEYLRNPDLNAGFAEIAHCNGHSNFATMNIKEPPDDDAKSVVLNFGDCKAAEGKSWDDVGPALQAWSEYRSAHGSQAGMWVLWPAYGGGEVDFDFKFVTSYRNYESLGEDYDQYGKEGYKKADELFTGLLDCDVMRSYVAVERRDGIPDED
jgi:hypothetical protein